MIKQITISLFWLAVFGAASVLAQSADQALQTNIIRLNDLRVDGTEYNFASSPEESSRLLGIVKPLLSRRGSAEIEAEEQILTVTDTAGRVRLVAELVKTLANSSLSITDLTSEASEKDEQVITAVVRTNHIFPITSCLLGKESSWMALQGFLLFKPLAKIKVRLNRIDKNEKDVEITGTEPRVALVRRLVALFDQPFLTEEADYDL